MQSNAIWLRTISTFMFVSLIGGCGSEKEGKPEEKTLTCVVRDVNISAEYSGECKDGLAQGKGVAKGRDKYEGSFAKGLPHGSGIYTWNHTGNGAVWDGQFYRGERSGLGTLSVDMGNKDAQLEYIKKDGALEGNKYVVRGFWLNGKLMAKCSPLNECMKGPPSDFVEINNNIKKQNLLLTTKEMHSRLAKSFAVFDKKLKGVSQCFASEIFDNYFINHPEKAILDANDQIDVMSIFNDNFLLIGIIPEYCLRNIQAGVINAKLSDNPYQTVDIHELKADMPSLTNQRVEVQGVGIQMMGFFLIKPKPEDATTIMVDFEKLPRDEKILVLKQCSDDVIFGCPIKISGKVGTVGMETGIVAEKIEILARQQQ
ncbi:hypothetical protein F8A87_05830 [Betaproteobacteria bacterium SCN2]|jgi:hypothetical protein|nr:hypothetical protein F8A87_05830 [Betaproteobacteria bacterium SCN2]